VAGHLPGVVVNSGRRTSGNELILRRVEVRADNTRISDADVIRARLITVTPTIVRVGNLPNLLTVVAPYFFRFAQTVYRVVVVTLLPLLDGSSAGADKTLDTRNLPGVFGLVNRAGVDVNDAVLIFKPLNFAGLGKSERLGLQTLIVRNTFNRSVAPGFGRHSSVRFVSEPGSRNAAGAITHG